MRAGLAQEGPEFGVGLMTGGRREDARSGVSGPPGVRRVDHRHTRPQGRQLVGQGEADQPRPHHRHVTASPVHAPESIRLVAPVPAVRHTEQRAARTHPGGAVRRAARLSLRPALRHAAGRAANALRGRGSARRARPCSCCTANPPGRTCTAPSWRNSPHGDSGRSRPTWSASGVLTSRWRGRPTPCRATSNGWPSSWT